MLYLYVVVIIVCSQCILSVLGIGIYHNTNERRNGARLLAVIAGMFRIFAKSSVIYRVNDLILIGMFSAHRVEREKILTIMGKTFRFL